jgi:tetratricopeptide (TPR) repeat protein
MLKRLPLLLALALGVLVSVPAGALPRPPEVVEINAQLAAGDLDAAIKQAEAWAKREPQSSLAQLWLGRVYGRQAIAANVFTKLSWAGKCREAWETAVKLDPSNIDARFDLLGYYLQAPGIAGGGRDKAEATLPEIDALHASFGELARGQIAASQKDLVAARRHFEAAVAADPESNRARNALANLHLSEKRNAEARAVWLQLMEIKPADAYATYQLGKMAAVTGEELEAGLAHLDAFLLMAETPEELSKAAAHWRRGQILVKLGRTDEARAALQLATAEGSDVVPYAKAELDKLGKG